MTTKVLLRIGLGFLAVSSAQIGFWALLAPRSFYDGFPGIGRTWVAVDGPFNEHLVRDVGALNLALLVLIGYAALRLTRDLVIVTAVAALVWGVPHLIYHAFNTEPLSGGDAAASLFGLGSFVVFAGALLYVGWSLPATGPDS